MDVSIARCGAADIDDLIRFIEEQWKPGHILVTEAGGKVTGIGGQTLAYGLPGAWQKNGLLATNGKLHAPTLQLIASCTSPPS